MTKREQLEFIFRGAAVQRFHVTPPIRPQTDGAHSFGVAWFCWLLTDGAASANLVMAALAHDLAEQETGDMPGMLKRQLIPGIRSTWGERLSPIENGALKIAGIHFELMPEEKKILDLADALEGMMFCVSERRLGNREAENWYRRWWNWTAEQAGGYSDWLNILDQLMTEAVL